jgi:hypothetical protein
MIMVAVSNLLTSLLNFIRLLRITKIRLHLNEWALKPALAAAAAGRPLAYSSWEDVPLPARQALSPQLIPAPPGGSFAGDKHASTNALYKSLMAFAAEQGL